MSDKEVSNEALQHDIQNLCQKFDRFIEQSQDWRSGIDERLRQVEIDLSTHKAVHDKNPGNKNGWRAMVDKFYAPVTVAVVVWVLVEVLPQLVRVLEP